MSLMKIKNFWKDNARAITILLFIFAIAFFVFDLINSGYDSYWHIAAGKRILEKGIPFADSFSWFGMVNLLPWTAHEWLSEIIFYCGSVLLKDASGLIFCISLSFMLFLFLFFARKKDYCKDYRLSLLWIVLGVFTVGGALSPRPHLFSYLLLAFSLFLLYDFYCNENTKKIYLLPVIGVFWSNLHGGSSNLLYILVFLFFFAEFLEKSLHPKKIKKYAFLILLTVLSLMINPYGFQMIIYPYLNMNDVFMKKMIVEWLPPSLTSLQDIHIWIFLGISLIFIFRYFKKYRKLDLLLFIPFFILACTSIRFVPLLYIVMSFFIFYPVKKIYLSRKSDLFLQLFCLFLFILSLFKIPSAYEVMNRPLINPEAIATLKKESPKRVFNYYDYGGYLISYGIPVFIDGRADVYSKTILKDSYQLSYLIGNYEWVIDNYQFDYYIIPKEIPLSSYLETKKENYMLLFEDQNTVLYKTL